jgi:hypothetical protein
MQVCGWMAGGAKSGVSSCNTQAADGYIIDDPTEVTSVTCDYDCPPDLQNKVIYGARKVRTFNPLRRRAGEDTIVLEVESVR